MTNVVYTIERMEEGRVMSRLCWQINEIHGLQRTKSFLLSLSEMKTISSN